MEEIIKRIIQIEEEATEIEKTVQETMKQKKMEQDKLLENLHQVLKEKAASKVNTLREWEMKTVEEELKRQQVVLKRQMDYLTQVEKEKMEVWVNSLFADITKE